MYNNTSASKRNPALVAALLLAATALGGRCADTSSKAKFGAQVPPTTSSTASKTWLTPQFIDIEQANALSTFHNNITANASTLGTSTRYAMAVWSPAAGKFAVLMNRGIDATAPNAAEVHTYAFEPTTPLSNELVTGLGNFTLLDSSTGTDPQRPIAAVNSSGHAMGMITTPRAAFARRPLALLRLYGAGTWNAAVDVSSRTVSGAGGGATNLTKTDSTAMASDGIGNFVTVWCQGTRMYFNQYRSSVGWRFDPDSPLDNSFDDDGLGGGSVTCEDVTLAGSGAALGFDSSGSGYAAYATGAGAIAIRRWSSSVATSFTGAMQELAASSTDTYPRLHIKSDGSGFAVFYRNTNVAAGSGELYLSTVSSSSTTFSVPVQLESVVGSPGGGTAAEITEQAGETDVLAPLLRSSGDVAAVGFIKTVLGTRGLYVSRYSGTSWSSLTQVDGGLGDVRWADLAVNASGHVAVVFTVTNGGVDRVYGTVYYNSTWSTPTLLDSLSTMVQDVAPSRYRPSIAIDSSGNAFATFSILDTAATRRAAGAIFR